MKISRFLRSSILAFSLGLPALTSRAADPTVITSLPYTISASGHYTVSGNLTSTTDGTPAIRISAPNVVLDLNGYYVAGPGSTAASGSTLESVIYVGDVANVKIMNGTVSGYSYGIVFAPTSASNDRDYVVDSVVVTRCYMVGIYFGAFSSSEGSLVRNCSLSDLGNSTYQSNQSVTGIETVIGGVRIENNTIGTLTPTGTGSSYGIIAHNGDFVIGNTVSGCTYGIDGGKYLNNLTFGCTTAFVNGTNATGNN